MAQRSLHRNNSRQINHGLMSQDTRSNELYWLVLWCSMNPTMNATHPFTTTSFDVAGYRVVKNFGVVRGIIVRSRSVVGNFGASIQSLFGGNITIYTELCELARDEAFRDMITHANTLGANAVIGIRYDATEVTPGITEVLCYGTAVQVEPIHP